MVLENANYWEKMFFFLAKDLLKAPPTLNVKIL
jgi:hypothetical protein